MKCLFLLFVFSKKLEFEQLVPAITQQTVHRIYFSCIVLALQSRAEEVNLQYLSKISGIETNDLIDMEHCVSTEFYTLQVTTAVLYQTIQDLSRVVHLPLHIEIKRPRSLKLTRHITTQGIEFTRTQEFVTVYSRFRRVSSEVSAPPPNRSYSQPTSKKQQSSKSIFVLNFFSRSGSGKSEKQSEMNSTFSGGGSFEVKRATPIAILT